MSGRKGDNSEDAIVLDDEEPEELNYMDLFDDLPQAKAALSHTVSCYLVLDPLHIDSSLQAASKINVPCDDDIFAYGEDFKKSVQSLIEAGSRHDKDQRTSQVLVPVTQKHKESLACRKGQAKCKIYHDDRTVQQPQVPTARMYSPSNRRMPDSRTTLEKCPPERQAHKDEKPIGSRSNLATATAVPKQKADSSLSMISQLAEKAPIDRSSSGKEPGSKKAGTLAQRMKLPSLPVITNGHGRPMGFAAMQSAEDDPRYASAHAIMDGEAASTAKEVPNTLPPTSPQAIVASCSSRKLPSKPRPKRVPKKKSDPLQPTLSILKSNSKRPLSEMGIHDLFMPGQVISNAEWQAKKRQRLKKKEIRALEDGGTSNGLQDVVETCPKGQDCNNLPDWTRVINCDVSDPTRSSPIKVQTATDTTLGEEPDLTRNFIETPDTPDSEPNAMPITTRPGPVGVSGNTDNQAMRLDGVQPAELILTKIVGPRPRKTTDTEVHSEEGSSHVEGFEPIAQQAIGIPAYRGKKKVHFEEPDVFLEMEKRSSKELDPLDFNNRNEHPLTTEEPVTRLERPIPTPRPVIGGKGISEATLAAWRATEVEDIAHTTPYHSTDEQEDDLITVTEPTYEYNVNRREWLIENPEGETSAEVLTFGPFHTTQEANAIAAREIHHPIQLGTVHGVPSNAWDYSFRQDHDGLQTQIAEALGVHIEAEVQRGKSTTSSYIT